jgi:methanogenic corrinoid protein MtbC1
MKNKLIEILRSVPITDKTYPEYIEAVADKLIDKEDRLVRRAIEKETYEQIFRDEFADVNLGKVIKKVGDKLHRGELSPVEEMARDMCDGCREAVLTEDCPNTVCDGVRLHAEVLYAKGYRKIADDHARQCTYYALGCQMAEGLKRKVAEEIFAEIEEGIKAAVSALQFNNTPIHRQVKHETYSSLMRFVKTIEKKYTEDT